MGLEASEEVKRGGKPGQGIRQEPPTDEHCGFYSKMQNHSTALSRRRSQEELLQVHSGRECRDTEGRGK